MSMESSQKRYKSSGRASSRRGRGRAGPVRRIPRLSTQRMSGAYQARSSRGAVARAARAMLNQRTAGFLGVEKKYFDSGLLAVTNIPTSATLTGCVIPPTTPVNGDGSISCPAQGDGPQNRDGKKFVIKSVQLKGFIDLPAQSGNAAVNDNKVFIALVLDTQSNGATCTGPDIFTNFSGHARLAVAPSRNLLFGKRFRILKSEIFDLMPESLSWNGASFGYHGVSKVFEWYVPLNLNVNCNAATTATITSVADNSLHVVAVCASTVDMQPTLVYNARIRFMG